MRRVRRVKSAGSSRRPPPLDSFGVLTGTEVCSRCGEAVRSFISQAVALPLQLRSELRPHGFYSFIGHGNCVKVGVSQGINAKEPPEVRKAPVLTPHYLILFHFKS